MGRIDFLNPDSSERLLFARLCDLSERAERGRMCFSRFLNLREQEIARAAISSYSVEHMFSGGFEGSEKLMLGLCDKGSKLEADCFPISLLTLEFKKDAEISHRDILGSLMSLGIERNSIGDIFLYDCKASFAVISHLEETVKREIEHIGRYPVNVIPYEGDGVIVKKTQDKSCVISSLRLDSVIAALTGKSRTAAAELIKKQPIFINDKRSDKIDETVPLGAVITIRGFGKFRLSSECSKTSKDRLRITVSKYI